MTKIREGYKETEIGVIPEDWEVSKLSQILQNRSEKYTPNEDEDFLYVALEHIVQESGRLIGIGKSSESTSTKSAFYKKDVLFGKLRPYLRKYWLSDIDGVCSTEILALKPLTHPEFAFYTIQSNKFIEDISNKAFGTKMPRTSWADMKDYKIPLPPLPEQKRIAEILSTTDAHIEKLDKIIEDYKLLKKGMMKKLLTEGIGHTEFKETEIGRIPKEWEVKPLGEIASICYGKNQKEIEDESGIYKILGTGGVMGKTNSYLWNQPSVLIGRKGTINKPMYIDEPFWTVDTLFYTKINYGYSGKWLYYYLNAIDLAKYNEATGVPSLNSNTLSKIQIAVPTYSQQLEIEYVLSSLDSNINLLNDEKQDFIQLKKSLMEKLLTGKIRVV